MYFCCSTKYEALVTMTIVAPATAITDSTADIPIAEALATAINADVTQTVKDKGVAGAPVTSYMTVDGTGSSTGRDNFFFITQ